VCNIKPYVSRETYLRISWRHDTILYMNETKALTELEIADFIAHNLNWREVEGKLVADFVLPDFKSAMVVMNKVAEYAEEINHHPEWSNIYNKLSFTLSTHDAGNRVTDLDIKLAERVSAIVIDSREQ
jgi:4a-hydroxytetrahydrobiopterin dehydratase